MRLIEIEDFMEINRNWRKVFHFLILICFLISINYSSLFASSGANFLRLGVGARAIGMGSAYTSIANDVTALYWNPAGLSQVNKREVGAMHAEMFADTKYDFVGYVTPPRKVNSKQTAENNEQKEISQPLLTDHGSRLTLGIGAVYLSQGSLEGRTEDRNRTSDFSSSDFALTIGAGRFVTKQSSLGMNIKLLQSKIAGDSSTGFAFDIGSLYHITTVHLPLSFGFAVQNIGPNMKFLDEGYHLPLTLANGASVKLFSAFLISSDLKYQPYDSKTSFSIGTEFYPAPTISLRAGYLANAIKPTSSDNNNLTEKLSNLSGLGLGIGFKIGSSNIDYSFTPAGELGNTQRISLSFKF